MMTNREHFLRAVKRQGPERVPLNTCFSTHGLENQGDCRCWGVPELRPNEWGYAYETLEDDKTFGQVTSHPLKSAEDLLSYAPPAVQAEKRFNGLSDWAERVKREDKFTFACVGSYVFERLHFLAGMEDLFDYLINAPEAVKTLGDKIVGYQCAVIRELARCGVDGVWGGDDWGLQDRLMISPRVWREVFKPWYAAIFHTAKEFGLTTYMHSCGRNNDILPDLIECGLDVVELHQPTVNGVDWLRENVGGRLCISTTADIQTTLPFGERAKIEREVRELYEKLGSFRGGLMYINYGDPEAIGITEDTERFYLDMCRKYSRY